MPAPKRRCCSIASGWRERSWRRWQSSAAIRPLTEISPNAHLRVKTPAGPPRMLRAGDSMSMLFSSLDWKLGARLLLKYPALTIVGGLSLAAAIALGAVGIEVADELLYKRLPFDEGSRIVRLQTQDAATLRVESRVLHDFAIWRRSLKTVTELGAARVSERNV